VGLRWRRVQFLASRGYGVLQVNYRGSGGRGDKFEEQAYKQWGGMIQDDITDGVKYAHRRQARRSGEDLHVRRQLRRLLGDDAADPQPGMYKCAIGYVGVYDLATAQQEQGIGERGRRTLLRRSHSRDDAAALAKASAALPREGNQGAGDAGATARRTTTCA
jgi:hypothetical protein